MGKIGKGTIASIDGNYARVIPADAGSRPTSKIVIPWHLRGKSGLLEKETEVIYAEFDDATGMLLGRADGEWGAYVPTLAAESITASGVSLAQHTHGNVLPGNGETGKPK